MRISDWSSDVCSSDLVPAVLVDGAVAVEHDMGAGLDLAGLQSGLQHDCGVGAARMAPDHAAGIVDEAAEFGHRDRSEERREGKECAGKCRSRGSPEH